MNGIQKQNSIPLLKDNAYDHQIMNVVEIFADTLAGDIGLNATDNEITCSTTLDLSSNMTRKFELSIIPQKFDL